MKRKSPFKATCVYMHIAQYEKLKESAKAQGLAASQLIRISINDYLKRNREPKD